MKKLKVLITRPRLQAEEFADQLHQAGLIPIYFPVIEIRPFEDNLALQQALTNLSSFDWLVFTSANGVEAVFRMMDQMGLERLPSHVRVAAIGPKTAEALHAHSILPAFVPNEYIAEAIVPGLGELIGCKVLLPRAEIARKALPAAIKASGGEVLEVPVYQTLPAVPDATGLRMLSEGVDIVTLTSSSTVENFVALVSREGLDPLHLPGDPTYACIGPITERTAQEYGLPNLIVATEYTTAGLIQAIQSREMRYEWI